MTERSIKSEELLANWCAKGDRKSQKYLYETFSNPIFRLMMRYVRSEDDAHDLLVVGFTKVFEKIDDFEFRGKGSLGKKTYLHHMIKAEASMMYIFNENPEGGYSTDINTFLGATYYVNSSKNPDKPHWFGIGLSYLVWRNGNFFDENTFRFTVGARFAKHFAVMPEIYISDGFKNVMPGLRMQVSF